MPYVKVKTGCSTCKIAYGNPKLSKRIHDATFKRQDGDESLGDIAKEYGLTRAAIYNHASKHIRRGADIKPILVEKAILKQKTEFQKKVEESFDHELAVPKEDYELALDRVIADGLQELKAGRTKVSVTQLLAAVKIKSDDRNRRRGQDLELIKSMYSFSSGKGKTSG